MNISVRDLQFIKHLNNMVLENLDNGSKIEASINLLTAINYIDELIESEDE